MIKFVKVFDCREWFAAKDWRIGDNVVLTPQEQDILVIRMALLESLLERTAPLLGRAGRIINDQVPGVPHLVEGSLESLRIEIEEALTKIKATTITTT